MRGLILFISLVFPTLAVANPAENKRLIILQEEQRSVQSELAGYRAARAGAKDAKLIKQLDENISVSLANLRALDTEIKNTGRIPVAFKGDKNNGGTALESKHIAKRMVVQKEEPLASEPNLTNSAPKNSWDIFNDY